MKLLSIYNAILLLLISNAAFGCMNQIAESEIPKAIALQPGAGAKVCGANDPCVCFDGVDWETAVYADVAVDDPSKPIYGKEEIEICDSEEKCKLIVSEKKCQKLNFKPIYIDLEDGNFEAYCTGVTGYRQMLVKQLQTDPVKAAEKEKRLQAEKDAEDTKKVQLSTLKGRVKVLSQKDDLTAAEVKEAILKLIKAKVLSGEL